MNRSIEREVGAKLDHLEGGRGRVGEDLKLIFHLESIRSICYTTFTMKTTKKVYEYELPIKIEKENGGYFAYCPVWSDCYAQGDTIDEVSTEIAAVAQTLVDIYKEKDLSVPLKKLKERSSGESISFTFPILVSA